MTHPNSRFSFAWRCVCVEESHIGILWDGCSFYMAGAILTSWTNFWGRVSAKVHFFACAIWNNESVTIKCFTFNVIIDHIQANEAIKRNHWMGKINFVETRSFWHIFRSFDRMWGFFILCLQVSLPVSFVLISSFIFSLFVWHVECLLMLVYLVYGRQWSLLHGMDLAI